MSVWGNHKSWRNSKGRKYDKITVMHVFTYDIDTNDVIENLCTKGVKFRTFPVRYLVYCLVAEAEISFQNFTFVVAHGLPGLHRGGISMSEDSWVRYQLHRQRG